MAERIDRYGNKIESKKRNAFFAPTLAVVIVAVLVFSVGVFFRVRTIEVEGASKYTEEEIISASGLQYGDNLFFVNRFSASSSIFSRLPFVDSASIDRSFPSTVIIRVEESSAEAWVDWMGQSWLLTVDGKLLGTATEEDIAPLIAVKGISPVTPSGGSAMEVEPEDESRFLYLMEILQAMQAQGFLGEVTELDVTTLTDPTFRYLDRFTVSLGARSETEYKLRLVLGAVAQLEADYTGYIDVSDGETVYVRPD